MPELSRFYGIVIKMYFGDHEPAHFHAEYAEDQAVLSIETLVIIGGRPPPFAPSACSLQGYASSARWRET